MKRTSEIFLRFYIFFQFLTAGFLLWSGWKGFLQNYHMFPVLLALVCLGLFIGQKPIPLNRARNLWMSLSDLLLYMVLFLYPFSVTVWFTAILTFCLYSSYLLLGVFRTKKLIFYHTVLSVISFGTGGFLFHVFIGDISVKNPLMLPGVLMAGLIVSFVYLINLAVNLGVSWKLNLIHVLRIIPSFVQYEELISTFLGALLAVLFKQAPLASILVAVPVLIYALSNEAYVGMQTEFSQLMEALLKAMETSDPIGHSHSQRVAIYAKEIASKLRSNPEEIRGIYELGLIHDLGTLGMPDDILYKTSKPSKEEWEVIHRHPLETQKLFNQFGRFEKQRLVIESHHERFDGRGYPRKLKGEEIPLAARILAIADAYDAITNDRPYRKRLSKEVALRRLWYGRGKQFDPYLVELWFEHFEEDKPSNEEKESLLWRISESLGLEMNLSPRELDDLHDAARFHNLNPPADIFAKPNESAAAWWQVDYREHLGVTDVMRRDLPSSEEVLKILWLHHEWVRTASEEAIPVESRILAISEAFTSCLEAGMSWFEALVKIKERAGTQFDRTVVSMLEGLITRGQLPNELFAETKQPPVPRRLETKD